MNITAMEWLRDHDAVRAHFRTHQIERRMESTGFARITGFLPPDVAAAASTMLAEQEGWEDMDDSEVADRSDSVSHSFKFAEPEDHPTTIGALADAVALLFEDLVPSFSVARYGRGDCIAPHDDKGHFDIEPKCGGLTVLHSRKVAGILYLSKGWKAKFGGALLDLEARAEHVPSFNTFIAFNVPRMHAVAPVLVDGRPRLSLFGWWLQSGKLYELDGDAQVEYADLPEVDHADAPEAVAPRGKGRRAAQQKQKQKQQQQQQSRGLKKKRSSGKRR